MNTNTSTNTTTNTDEAGQHFLLLIRKRKTAVNDILE